MFQSDDHDNNNNDGDDAEKIVPEMCIVSLPKLVVTELSMCMNLNSYPMFTYSHLKFPATRGM